MIKAKLLQIIAENRRSVPARLIAKCSDKYLHGW